MWVPIVAWSEGRLCRSHDMTTIKASESVNMLHVSHTYRTHHDKQAPVLTRHGGMRRCTWHTRR